ncbi:hypothetical protein EXIGLDRAFT_771092 [Exidia glandulosa HHB12029]|uniref:Uncharacterized protein n=1 Tax=Exidia glandulosa HHB12029 TaxID=1314781 RepID=A0A165G900_EXIGL|nr:hypothetical protein EXIGLDRAFT_771092 [Exidia glandulosa HHB12029]
MAYIPRSNDFDTASARSFRSATSSGSASSRATAPSHPAPMANGDEPWGKQGYPHNGKLIYGWQLWGWQAKYGPQKAEHARVALSQGLGLQLPLEGHEMGLSRDAPPLDAPRDPSSTIWKRGNPAQQPLAIEGRPFPQNRMLPAPSTYSHPSPSMNGALVPHPSFQHGPPMSPAMSALSPPRPSPHNMRAPLPLSPAMSTLSLSHHGQYGPPLLSPAASTSSFAEAELNTSHFPIDDYRGVQGTSRPPSIRSVSSRQSYDAPPTLAYPPNMFPGYGHPSRMFGAVAEYPEDESEEEDDVARPSGPNKLRKRRP